MTLTDEKRDDRAEMKAFRPGYNGSGGPRNLKSQVLLVVAFAATLTGGSLALWAGEDGQLRLIGLCVLAVAFPALVITAVWCFRNWDY
jgi:hypothetical protein